MRLTLAHALVPLVAGGALAVAAVPKRVSASPPTLHGPIDGLEGSSGDSDDPGQNPDPRRVVPGEGPTPSGPSRATGGTTALGSWQTLTNPIPVSAGIALLLTDGTVVVQEVLGSDWWRLTPDASGSYVDGTWSELPPMPNGYAPLYFASAVLPDGRLVVLGGEYTGPVEERTETTEGAIYDPTTNAWTEIAPPPSYSCIGDASAVVLPDGRLLLATCWGKADAVLDPATLTWTSPFSHGKGDNGHEEGWTLLQDGRVLTVDTMDFSDLRASEMLDPATGAWSFAGDLPRQISSLSIANPTGGHEVGPGLLRPDGTVWAVGANGRSAIWHPDGVWTEGPSFPDVPAEGQLDTADGPGTVLPNGHAMVVASPWEGPPPLHVYDFDGATLTEIAGPPQAPGDAAYATTMLLLPTGQVLFTDETNDVEIFTSKGAPLRSSAPVVDAARLGALHPGATVTLSGRQLNGVYSGSAYGDDDQQATNYPLVRLTNVASGHVTYARTHDHSSMSVARGNPSHTKVDVPAAQELGPTRLEVVANGVASAPITVNVTKL
jgi:hypothetical protein